VTHLPVRVNIGGRAARFIYIISFWLLSLGISSLLVFGRIIIKFKVIIKQLNIA
jgi:hypothetical protein